MATNLQMARVTGDVGSFVRTDQNLEINTRRHAVRTLKLMSNAVWTMVWTFADTGAQIACIRLLIVLSAQPAPGRTGLGSEKCAWFGAYIL